jgi:hypothetical protein
MKAPADSIISTVVDIMVDAQDRGRCHETIQLIRGIGFVLI